ncbi:copper resistance D family protein [Neobacillus sp. SCS-31]|uniref:copper resistance D family protein n=1 Tax=Neobacillus oceani TaxID=3115292 RepID=UPI00390630F0
MSVLIPITEFGQYILISFLTGYFLLDLIPEKKKPRILVPKKLVQLCVVGTVFISFIPLLNIIFIFKDSYGLLGAASASLIETQAGRSWIFLTIWALLLWLNVYFNWSKIYRLQLLMLMVFAIANGSHVASLSKYGIYSHSAHFILVAVWVGVLLIVGWFSEDSENWREFLNWFTVLAIGCLAAISVTGFFLMDLVMADIRYVESWAIPYGRMLLLKHLSIIPVLAFALINGVLSRKLVKNHAFDPRKWIRAECLLLMLVFYCTGVMGTLSPPHVAVMNNTPGNSITWVDWLFMKTEFPQTIIGLSPTISSISLIGCSLLFICFILISFKKMNRAFAVALACFSIVTFYLGFMLSVDIGGDRVKSNPVQTGSKQEIVNYSP